MSLRRKNSRRLKFIRRKGYSIDGNFMMTAEAVRRLGLTKLGRWDLPRMLVQVDLKELATNRGWRLP